MASKDDAARENTKDNFRAALERKKGQQHPHEAAGHNDGKVDHEHRAAGGKRTFRRKSG